jgi:hypothetical protein
MPTQTVFIFPSFAPTVPPLSAGMAAFVFVAPVPNDNLITADSSVAVSSSQAHEENKLIDSIKAISKLYTFISQILLLMING